MDLNSEQNTLQALQSQINALKEQLNEKEAALNPSKHSHQSKKLDSEVYHLLFQQMNDAAFVHELLPNEYPGHFIEVNEEACRRLGYSRAELLQMTPLDINTEEFVRLYPHMLATALNQPRALFETNHVAKSGKVIPVEVSSYRLELHGRPVRLSIVRDITQRKSTEDELRASEVRFRNIFEKSPIGIELYDAEGSLLEVNSACMEIFGVVDASELRQFNLFADPNLSEENKQALRRGQITRYESPFDFEIVKQYGLYRTTKAGTIWLDVLITPLANAPGQSESGYMVQVQDMTQRKLAEGQIQLLNATLDQRVRERTSELEASNRELEAFAYSIAHDLRTPLRSVTSFSDLVLEETDGLLDEQARADLLRVRDGGLRMAQMIDDLLRLSRVTRTELEPREVNLTGMVSELFAIQTSEDLHRNVEILVEPGLSARADPGLIRIALENLLQNALKFTSRHPSATIKFGASENPNGKTFFVRDDGAGFDPAYASKLFKPFQRLHTHGDYEGHGIGLAISYRIIQRHGGKMWAEGAVEGGATFYFTLPEG